MIAKCPPRKIFLARPECTQAKPRVDRAFAQQIDADKNGRFRCAANRAKFPRARSRRVAMQITHFNPNAQIVSQIFRGSLVSVVTRMRSPFPRATAKLDVSSI